MDEGDGRGKSDHGVGGEDEQDMSLWAGEVFFQIRSFAFEIALIKIGEFPEKLDAHAGHVREV